MSTDLRVRQDRVTVAAAVLLQRRFGPGWFTAGTTATAAAILDAEAVLTALDQIRQADDDQDVPTSP